MHIEMWSSILFYSTLLIKGKAIALAYTTLVDKWNIRQVTLLSVKQSKQQLYWISQLNEYYNHYFSHLFTLTLYGTIDLLHGNNSHRDIKMTFQHIADLHLDHNLAGSRFATRHRFSDGGFCCLRDGLSFCSASNVMGSDEWWQTRRGNRCVTGFDKEMSTNSLWSESVWVSVCHCIRLGSLERLIWRTSFEKCFLSTVLSYSKGHLAELRPQKNN